MRCDCEAECELMSVGEAYVLTVEKARAHPLCQALARGGVDRELSAAKHCYLALYLLCTRYDAACPFARARLAAIRRAIKASPTGAGRGAQGGCGTSKNHLGCDG
jgi:hypothetical protein